METTIIIHKNYAVTPIPAVARAAHDVESHDPESKEFYMALDQLLRALLPPTYSPAE